MQFSPNAVASAAQIGAARYRLGRLVWPTRILCFVSLVGALNVADIVGDAMSAWVGSQTDYALRPITGLVLAFLHYWVAAGATFLSIVSVVVYVATALVFDPWHRLQTLNGHKLLDAISLAERWPLVDTYRMRVTAVRDFVVGDLEVMDKLAEVSSKLEEEQWQQAAKRQESVQAARLRSDSPLCKDAA